MGYPRDRIFRIEDPAEIVSAASLCATSSWRPRPHITRTLRFLRIVCVSTAGSFWKSRFSSTSSSRCLSIHMRAFQKITFLFLRITLPIPYARLRALQAVGAIRGEAILYLAGFRWNILLSRLFFFGDLRKASSPGFSMEWKLNKTKQKEYFI